ncbi:MAG: hypothetical protein JEY99_07845 [Spirochaetales bacterium]|nr:hypothetical protein [Spirochaetales bacterium]
MLKKGIYIILLAVSMLLLSCPGGTFNPGDNSSNNSSDDENTILPEIPSGFRGFWVDPESQRTLSFSLHTYNGGYYEGYDGIVENYIISETELDTGSDNYTLINDSILKRTNNGYEFIYFKSPNNTVDVSGTVSFQNSSSGSLRGISSIGNINIILSNMEDSEDIVEINNLTDGSDFIAESLTTGETYTMTAFDSDTNEELTSMPVSPQSKDEDFGIFNLSDEDYLIKTKLEPPGRYLMADGREYSITFDVYNYGTLNSPASIVTVSSDTLDINPTSITNNLPTLDAGGNQLFEIDLSLASVTNFEEDHEVSIEVVDGNGQIWQDRFTLTFFKEGYHFAHWTEYLTSTLPYGNILVLSPEEEITIISKGYWTLNSIVMEGKIPKWTDPFYIMFTGARTSSYEHKLIWGLDINPDLYINENNAVSPLAFESNDSLTDAQMIFQNQPIITYIATGDVDIFKVHPSTLQEVTGVTTSGTVPTGRVYSWDAVTGAEGYNIFRREVTSTWVTNYGDEWFTPDAYSPSDDSRPMGLKLNETLITGTSFIDTTFISGAGIQYMYTVQAYSSTQGYSPVSLDSSYRIIP